MSKAKTKTEPLAPLTPPDLKQCQAEKPNGATFMSLGGVPALIRCRNKPQFILTEKVEGKDGRIGSMALCADCLAVAHNDLGDAFIVEKIEKG